MPDELPELQDEAVRLVSRAEPRQAWGLPHELKQWRKGRFLPSEKASLVQLECLGILRGVKTLECGCGVGWMSSLLLALGARLCATEAEPGLLHDLSRRIPQTTPLCRANPMDGWREAAPFDRICPTEILFHEPASLRSQLAHEGRLVYWLRTSEGLELRLEILAGDKILRERLALVKLERGTEELIPLART
jgi:protein-L-isoaspartate O-methyltransferase